MADSVLFNKIAAAAEVNPQSILFSLVTNQSHVEDITYAKILEQTLFYDAILKNYPSTICVIYHRFNSEFIGFVLSALKNNVKILIRRTSLTDLNEFHADFALVEKHIPAKIIFSDLPLSGDFQELGAKLFLRSEGAFDKTYLWDFIQFSSGSMNNPSGFCLNFNALLESAAHVIDVNRISSESIVVSYLTLSHIYGFVTGFVLPILSGASCLHCPTKIIKANPELLLELTTEKKVTHIFAILKTLEKAFSAPNKTHDLSSLFCVSIGGEKVNYDSYRRVRAELANRGMNFSGLVNSYGMSELGSLTMEDPLKGNKVVERDGKKILSVGEADYKGLKIRIFDDEHKEFLSNLEGDVGISADNIADFYFHERKINPVPKTIISGREYYFNGDSGFLSEGKLYITGRKANTIAYNGLKISGAFFKEFVKKELTALGLENIDCLICNLPDDTDKVICYISVERVEEKILNALSRQIKKELHVDIYDFLIEPYNSTGIEKISLPKVIEMYTRHKKSGTGHEYLVPKQ